MTTTDLRVRTSDGWLSIGGLKWKEAWAVGSSYSINDVVSYQGKLYVAQGTMAPGIIPSNPVNVSMYQQSDSADILPYLALGPNVLVPYSYANWPATVDEYIYRYFDVTSPGTVTIDVTVNQGDTFVRLDRAGRNFVAQSLNGSDIVAAVTSGRYYVRGRPYTTPQSAASFQVIPSGGAIVSTPALGWNLFVPGVNVKDEGSALTQRDKLNFVGTGVTVTDDSANAQTLITIPDGVVVQDEGAALTRRDKVNFVGAGVTATDDSGNTRTLITIPGGAEVYQQTAQPSSPKIGSIWIGEAP